MQPADWHMIMCPIKTNTQSREKMWNCTNFGFAAAKAAPKDTLFVVKEAIQWKIHKETKG